MISLALATILTAAPMQPATQPLLSPGQALAPAYAPEQQAEIDQWFQNLAMLSGAPPQQYTHAVDAPQKPPLSEAERQEKTQGMAMVFGGLTSVLLLLKTICTRQLL